MNSRGGRSDSGRQSSGRGGGGGFDSGGRGRGGRDSGGRGGGGRDGGNLSGRNRHMGEVSSIMALATANGMSDGDILAVIEPPAADRNRGNCLDTSSSLESAYTQTSKMFPSHVEWRNTLKIGKVLNPTTQIVRSNHFLVDTSTIKKKLCQYAVHIYRFSHSGEEVTPDCAGEEDSRITTGLIILLRDNHPEWGIGNGVGFTYNGRSIVYTSSPLPLAGQRNGVPFHEEILRPKKIDGSNSNTRFRVTLTLTDTIVMPDSTVVAWRNVTEERILLALDTPLLSFARWGVVEDTPEWFTFGSKAFKSNSRKLPLSPAYNAQRGYYAGLKTCMAGLVLVSDMSVSCFLNGGPLIDVMSTCAGYRSVAEMNDDALRRGIPPEKLSKLATALKGAKVKLTHLGHFRKIKSFGPPASSTESNFNFNGTVMTVAQYFVVSARVNGSIYKTALPSGKLKYPALPCVNLGSSTKPIYVPPELVAIPGGQCRSKVATPEMTAKMITEAAVRPDERMKYIIEGNNAEGSIVSVLRRDPTATAFGLHNIAPKPMAISAILLPNGKIRYAGNTMVDPKFLGTWNMDGKKFSNSPPGAGAVGYGILVVGGNGPPGNRDLQTISNFQRSLEGDATLAGVPLNDLGHGVPLACGRKSVNIKANLVIMKAARIVVVVLIDDCYGEVKLIADAMGLLTQCCRFRKIEKLPRGYTQNMMLKINTKLGGTNHTLMSRLARIPTGAPSVYQDPPASIAWIFDKPFMLVGIDVSHGQHASDQQSVAAVVASMDGRCSQYAANISSQVQGQEMVTALESAMHTLLNTYKSKNNGIMPSSIIVYRDGVGEGQFSQVTTIELNAIRGAVELMGYTTDAVKICIVICQKGHHTRFVYEDVSPGNPMTYINPCPGLCIDASGGADSIASGRLNEFYLNSHAAIQGTAKPCKYTLVHDEIGFKMCELEILTYWLTYLYCRANKAVSYASPAYYAHWASKRGKTLCAAGAGNEELRNISTVWSAAVKPSMFFI